MKSILTKTSSVLIKKFWFFNNMSQWLNLRIVHSHPRWKVWQCTSCFLYYLNNIKIKNQILKKQEISGKSWKEVQNIQNLWKLAERRWTFCALFLPRHSLSPRGPMKRLIWRKITGYLPRWLLSATRSD